MSESANIARLSAELDALLGDKLGLSKGALPGRLKRAGRRLPRHLRRDAAVIGEAIELDIHPKLRRRIDGGRVHEAHARMRAHLRGIDPADRRRGALLGMLGALAFNLLLFGALAVAFLKWQGLV